MRIGILTFHKPINYGAFLQAFSLAEGIQENIPNANVEIVDYIAPKESKKIVINVLWGIKHYGVLNGFKDLKKICSFHKSYSALPLSSKIKNTDLKYLYEYIDERYDILIIGSDAVFNWNQNGYPSAFIPNYDFKKCKILTYAASVHGLKYLDEKKERLDECGLAFSKINILGVRDRNTEKFVKYCNAKTNPMHCCDPTVCINIEKVMNNAGNYIERIKKKFKLDINKKFIIIMLPDGKISKKIREEFGKEYKIVTLFKPSEDADFYLYDLNPFEWAAVISKAKLVVTSYFHGTLLSLRQVIPVIAIDYSDYNTKDYEGKLSDLLKRRVGLPELYFDNCDISKCNDCDMVISVAKKALQGEFNSRIKKGMEQEGENFVKYIHELKNSVKVLE